MNRKFPSVRRGVSRYLVRAITAHLAIVLARRAKGLVEFLQQMDEPEVRRRFERIVVAHRARANPATDRKRAARRVINLHYVFGEPLGVQESR